jgi:hypothetical protein
MKSIDQFFQNSLLNQKKKMGTPAIKQSAS